MKKIYSLIALVAMFAVSLGVNAQKYHLVQKATAPEVGVDYALYNPSVAVNEETKVYATSKDGLGDALYDESYLWQLEATGEKSDDGYNLYVLKNVEKDAYWQETDFENNLGLDGYDVFHYAIVNCTWGEKATACRFTVLQAGSTDDWRSDIGGTKSSDGFVLARNKEVDQGDGSFYYYKLGRQNVNIAFEPWNEDVVWQLWTVAVNGPKDKLQELVNIISRDVDTYVAGKDPGMYETEGYNRFKSAYEAALTALTQSLSDDEYTNLYDELNAANDALPSALIPMRAGYYFFVNGTPGFLDQQGVEKGLYASNATTPNWKDFVLEDMKANKDYSFLWQIIPSGDQWQLKNVLYGTIYNGPNTNALSQQCFLTANGTRKVYFESLGKLQWQVKDNFSDKGLHAEGHSGGAGKSGKIVTWNTGADNASAWYIRTADQEFVDAAIAYAAQLELIASVEPLCVMLHSLSLSLPLSPSA